MIRRGIWDIRRFLITKFSYHYLSDVPILINISLPIVASSAVEMLKTKPQLDLDIWAILTVLSPKSFSQFLDLIAVSDAVPLFRRLTQLERLSCSNSGGVQSDPGFDLDCWDGGGRELIEHIGHRENSEAIEFEHFDRQNSWDREWDFPDPAPHKMPMGKEFGHYLPDRHSTVDKNDEVTKTRVPKHVQKSLRPSTCDEKIRAAAERLESKLEYQFVSAPDLNYQTCNQYDHAVSEQPHIEKPVKFQPQKTGASKPAKADLGHENVRLKADARQIQQNKDSKKQSVVRKKIPHQTTSHQSIQTMSHESMSNSLSNHRPRKTGRFHSTDPRSSEGKPKRILSEHKLSVTITPGKEAVGVISHTPERKETELAEKQSSPKGDDVKMSSAERKKKVHDEVVDILKGLGLDTFLEGGRGSTVTELQEVFVVPDPVARNNQCPHYPIIDALLPIPHEENRPIVSMKELPTQQRMRHRNIITSDERSNQRSYEAVSQINVTPKSHVAAIPAENKSLAKGRRGINTSSKKDTKRQKTLNSEPIKTLQHSAGEKDENKLNETSTRPRCLFRKTSQTLQTKQDDQRRRKELRTERLANQNRERESFMNRFKEQNEKLKRQGGVGDAGVIVLSQNNYIMSQNGNTMPQNPTEDEQKLGCEAAAMNEEREFHCFDNTNQPKLLDELASNFHPIEEDWDNESTMRSPESLKDGRCDFDEYIEMNAVI